MTPKYEEDIGRYLLPEMKTYIYCFLCLEIAKKKSKKVKVLYDRLVESVGLPELKAVQEKLKSIVPTSSVLMKILNDESESKVARARKENKVWFPNAQAYKNIGNKIMSRGFNPVKLFFIRRRMAKSGDVAYFQTLCEEVIKVGFNKESDQLKGIYKVTASTAPSLVEVIFFMAFGQSRGAKITEKNGQYTLKMNGKYYDLTNIIVPKTSDRTHRLLTKSFKDSGYSLEHAETIVHIVERWYECRVIHSGIEDYCNDMEIQGKADGLDVANISKSIKECDEAMGYPREKR
jgi:hypothetical protein